MDGNIGIFDSSLAVNYSTFGGGSLKLVGNPATTGANDVILLCFVEI